MPSDQVCYQLISNNKLGLSCAKIGQNLKIIGKLRMNLEQSNIKEEMFGIKFAEIDNDVK